ncbi:transcriptional regulator, AraC family [Actinacidiphila yanglinensis]|uniref:Transcriptional regulator, AraC family n=2 Tax=Actinacidiphila yanglinensis TaxID=310779 RepID=A0A1H6E2R7_9ACTN|nr:transcriptional regulator, AraC family [Actinacidiphila yanglinensis]
MTSGLMIVDQEHRQVKVGAGDLLLYDMSRPTEMRVTGSGHITLLHLPKSAVPLADHSVRGLLLRRLPLDGSGALLAGFLQGLAAARWSGLEAERLGSAAVQLASAFLGGLADREEISPQESRKIVLLRQVKTFIAAHLTETRLGPQVIADAHFISVRSLHLLFRAEKQTVSAYIRGERLERCRSDLGQPCRATTPVEAIGARWGFADATSFSRAFKASFGMPPGEYRRWLDGAATVRP